MDNWIITSLLSAFSFAIANLFIARLSSEGIHEVNYVNSGAIVFCSLYFFVTSDCWKSSPQTQLGILDNPFAQRRLLWRPDNGKFDWRIALCLAGTAMSQTAIFLSIVLNFKVAQ
jgi:hypothetical protein